LTTLGKNIRDLRHRKGWSQEDIALKLDISIPAFSKIETGIGYSGVVDQCVPEISARRSVTL
jgi:transcriptional regulator with XRE-family HTH domain